VNARTNDVRFHVVRGEAISLTVKEAFLMTDHEEEIERATARFAATWATFSGDTQGADHSADSLLVRRWADSCFPFWNIAIVPSAAKTQAQVRASLSAGAEYARTKRQSGSIWIAEERLALLGDQRARVLAEVGLVEGGTLTEMTASIPSMTLRDGGSLSFERVEDERALAALADINAEAYGLAAEVARAGIVTAPQTWLTSAYSYLAYEGDDLVSVASVLPHGGRLYLGLVATRPGAQRRGLAASTVSHALMEAHLATGLDPTDLHATQAGAPVYRQLGYQPATSFRSLRLAETQ
jgi:GNAT superfamily N-acetyltransferase